MCKAHSSSGQHSQSSQQPSAWYTYFVRECLQRGTPPDSLVGGQLANWISQYGEQTPPLRLRERAWMQLLAQDNDPEITEAYTASAERLDKPRPAQRQIR